MPFRNIKVEFEYLGTTYPGVAVPDGVELKVGSTGIDGFPETLIFDGAVTPYPTIFVGGLASISKHPTTATESYYVLTAA